MSKESSTEAGSLIPMEKHLLLRPAEQGTYLGPYEMSWSTLA